MVKQPIPWHRVIPRRSLGLGVLVRLGGEETCAVGHAEDRAFAASVPQTVPE